MKTTDELVRELADRETIRDLAVIYCDCLWRKDVEGLIPLFVEDATFVMEGLEVKAVSHGHAQIRRMHEKAFSLTNPRLFVHNQIVKMVDEDHATGRCCVEVRDGREWIGVGYFEDEYVKADGQWKFSSRRHSFDGIDEKIFIRTFVA